MEESHPLITVIFSLHGGVGVYQTNGTLIINSGTYSGGAAGAFGGRETTIALSNLGAPGVLISENANITGGTFMGSQDYDTAIILRIAIYVTIDGNANI